ncbi:hypothetical protein JR316_0007341 [Psilocybe cubensis]|uniref:Uncharacterized protein n=2 Tax=Psilocybe cubensis TaxID=181762 RepID=A0A8H8CG93_PSICU|nr:hypothetical protein JR316_0007341 [Psilocybe cubensis]KAH9480741.1 hypothetical protein JR316_0007341 [Psilocybe cubensis]
MDSHNFQPFALPQFTGSHVPATRTTLHQPNYHPANYDYRYQQAITASQHHTQYQLAERPALRNFSNGGIPTFQRANVPPGAPWYEPKGPSMSFPKVQNDINFTPNYGGEQQLSGSDNAMYHAEGFDLELEPNRQPEEAAIFLPGPDMYTGGYLELADTPQDFQGPEQYQEPDHSASTVEGGPMILHDGSLLQLGGIPQYQAPFPEPIDSSNHTPNSFERDTVRTKRQPKTITTLSDSGWLQSAFTIKTSRSTRMGNSGARRLVENKYAGPRVLHDGPVINVGFEDLPDIPCPYGSLEGCWMTCHGLSELDSHLREVHKLFSKKEKDQALVECQIDGCASVLAIGAHLRHVLESHTNVRVYCTRCDYSSPRKNSVLSHYKKNHGKFNRPTYFREIQHDDYVPQWIQLTL